MPTYEYVCLSCAHEFEQFQPMKDAPLRKCPECGKMKLKRKVGGGAGLIFKGTGFYHTDYKKKSGGEPKAAESKSSGDAKSTGSTPASPATTTAPAKTAAPAKPAAPAAKS
jgi:putative FmdB family regulatory protein